TGTETGDAEAAFVPRLVGEPVAIRAYELDGDKKEPVFGRVMSNLALDGDRVVFGMSVNPTDGRILCMNRETGKVEWAFDAPDLKAVFCTPTIAGGKVYCGEGMHEDRGRRLFCISATDGSAAWKEPFTTESHTEGAPAVAGGKVYFPAGDDGLYCADAGTGARLWQFGGGKEKGIHIDAAPVVSNGTVFVGSGLYNYVAVALDANTGQEKWRTDLKLRVFGQPLVSGSKVFYGAGTGNMGADVWKYDEEGEVRDRDAAGAVSCLDAATGKEEWRYPLPKSVHTGLAADAFSVYAGCRDGNVYALDRRTGKLRWRAGIGSALVCAPAVAAEGGAPVAVYAVSREGRVFCLNPQTGAVAWERGGLPGYEWRGREEDNVMCSPLVVTTPTPTGSKRTIYIGAMLIDPNPNVRHVAVFKFEDVIGE
ncbi:MAG TPA: PQQ-binding-like beta-propeller repeat protein, partial [Gemmata sp.]